MEHNFNSIKHDLLKKELLNFIFGHYCVVGRSEMIVKTISSKLKTNTDQMLSMTSNCICHI